MTSQENSQIKSLGSLEQEKGSRVNGPAQENQIIAQKDEKPSFSERPKFPSLTQLKIEKKPRKMIQVEHFEGIVRPSRHFKEQVGLTKQKSKSSANDQKIDLMNLDQQELKQRQLKELREKVRILAQNERIHTLDIEHLIQNNQELQSMNSKYKKTAEDLEKDNIALHQLNKQLVRDNQFLRQELDQVMQEIDSKYSQVQKYTQEKHQLTKELDRKANQIHNLNTDIGNKDKDIENLKKRITEIQKQAEKKLKKTQSDLNSQLEAVFRQLQDTKLVVKCANKQASMLSEKEKKLDKTLRELEKVYNVCCNEKLQLQKTTQFLKEQVQAYYDKLQKALAQTEQQQVELKKQMKNSNALKIQIAQISKQYSWTMDQNQKLRQKALLDQELINFSLQQINQLQCALKQNADDIQILKKNSQDKFNEQRAKNEQDIAKLNEQLVEAENRCELKHSNFEELVGQALQLRNQAQQLLKHKMDLQATLNLLNEKNKKYEAQLSSQKQQILAKDQNRTVIENNMVRLKNQIKDLMAYKDQWSQLQKAKLIAENQMKIIFSDKAKVQESLRATQRQNSSLTIKISDILANTEGLKMDISSLKKQIKAKDIQIEESRNIIKKLKEDQAKKQLTFKNYVNTVEGYKEMLKKNEESQLKLRRQIDQISKKYWDCDFKVNQMNDKLNLQEKMRDTLQKQLQKANQTLNQKRKEAQANSQENSCLKEEIKSLKQSARLLTKQHELLKDQNQKLKINQEAAKKKENKALKAKEAELKAKKIEVQQLSGQIRTLQQINSQMQKRCASITSKVQLYQELMKNQKIQIDLKQNFLIECKNSLGEKQAKLQALSKQLEAISKRYSQKEEQTNSLEMEKEDLKRHLSKKEQEVQKLVQDMQVLRQKLDGEYFQVL